MGEGVKRSLVLLPGLLCDAALWAPQVGALELGRFADGVFFVDLAPVSDAELVSATMASAQPVTFDA